MLLNVDMIKLYNHFYLLTRATVQQQYAKHTCAYYTRTHLQVHMYIQATDCMFRMSDVRVMCLSDVAIWPLNLLIAYLHTVAFKKKKSKLAGIQLQTHINNA